MVSALLVLGVPLLIWRATGGGYGNAISAVLLCAFMGYVAFTLFVPFAFLTGSVGSIRQAKRKLHAAEREAGWLGVLRARAQLRAARWRYRQ